MNFSRSATRSTISSVYQLCGFSRSSQVTASLFFLYGISRSAEYLINLHLGEDHHARVNEVVRQQRGVTLSRSYYLLGIPDVFRSCCRSLVRSRSQAAIETMAGIHPAYTNQKAYETVFPLVTAFALFFNGVWWWEMAVSLFIQANKEQIGHNMNGMHAVHYAYSHMIYPHLLWVLVAGLLVTLLFRWLEPMLSRPDPVVVATAGMDVNDKNHDDLEVDLQMDIDHSLPSPLYPL